MPVSSTIAGRLLFSALIMFIPLQLGCAGHRAKPWRKPPEQWSKDDANQVWFESPWVKTKKVVAYPEARNPVPNPGTIVDMQDPTRVVTSFYWTESSSKEEPITNEYRARWLSSRTLCLADEGRSPGDSSWSALCKDRYEIRILVDQLVGFSADEVVLSENSYLLPSKLGTKLRPASVEHTSGGKLIFVFQRRTDAGRPAIQPGENSVLFVYSDGESRWKVKFRPKEMVGAGGPDL